MKKNFLAILICLAALSILIGFASAKLLPSKNHTLKLTKDGFDPSNIVISKGDRVTWLNTDTRLHWPASNPHPVHTEYISKERGCISSALDACHGLKKGESFSFTFEKIGIWGMHDHLFPGDSMSIVVSKKTSFLTDWVSKFISKPATDSIPPTKEEFRKLDYGKRRNVMIDLAKKDPNAAWKYLKAVAIGNGGVEIPVHEFAHSVGRELYKKYAFKGISMCTKEFAYGCYHGVTEQALLTKGKDSIPEIEKDCLKLYPAVEGEGKHPRDPGCIHGMGHGLLTWNNLDMRGSLSDCGAIAKAYQSFCWDGVFMEYSMSDTRTFDTQHPWKFCTVLPQIYREKCASYIVNLYLKSNSADTKKLADMCIQAPDSKLRSLCSNRIGENIAQQKNGKLEYILTACKTIENQPARTDCFIGAAREVYFQNYPSRDAVAQEICDMVSEDQKARCNSYVDL